MLGPTGDGSGALGADAVAQAGVGIGGAGVDVDGVGGLRDDAAVGEAVGGDELALARVPRRQHLGRRRAPQDPRVDQPRELNVRDVSRCRVDALEVPDRFGPGEGRGGVSWLVALVERRRQGMMMSGRGEERGKRVKSLRGWIDFVEKPAAVVLVEDARESPLGGQIVSAVCSIPGIPSHHLARMPPSLLLTGNTDYTRPRFTSGSPA